MRINSQEKIMILKVGYNVNGRKQVNNNNWAKSNQQDPIAPPRYLKVELQATINCQTLVILALLFHLQLKKILIQLFYQSWIILCMQQIHHLKI